MRLYAAVCLFALSAFARAEVCAKLEYAELDSMQREELLQLHCQHQDDMLALAASGSSANMRLASKCAEEADRTERIVARKYGIGSSGDERTREVNAMCPRR